MSNMSKTQLINSDASANTNSANSHIELVPGGSAETGPDSVSSTHTQVTNLTSTTVNGPSTSSSSSSPREERLAPPITSADLDSQPVQNILSSVSVQSTSGVCLQVELHDGTVYNVDSRDNPTVVEDLCIQLLKRYFPKMGPAAVQLFGLASIDKKQIPKMLWVNPCITIEELKRHILNSPTAGGKNTFFLRIRYVPGRKFLHNLPALGPEILKYLYLQCKDDFVKSRLSDIYEQDIKNEAKARGYAVLSIVIASKMEEKDCQDILNKQKLEAFLPSHLVVRLWRGYQLRKNMKTKTEEFLAQHSNTKVEELLMGYIKDVLNEVQSYGVERYEAKKVSGSLRPVHITLDVQQHEENGNTQYKGLFIDNEFFSSIDDFRSIHITPNHADQKKLSWNVHLDRSNGCPEVLRFDSKTVAESFVSGVNGYYRLITDYYMNLSQQMELPSLQEINRLKCHGPIDTSTAVRKLKTKYLSDEYYILKQSMQVFDQLAILFCYGGQTRKRLIDKKENMYCLEGENEEEFKDINCLIKYMAETRNLLPKHPMKVKPQQEPVDVLRKLFVEEIIPDDDEEAATNNQRRKPYIILPEEIKIKELIERGTFTEVFVCDLESGTLHAAKRLRQTSNDQMFRCYEHFQHAVQQLIRMEDPKFFVRVHGLVLSTPPMLVMEKAQYGSLASFFRRRQTSQPIKPFHLLNAASQVAQGMLFLNEHQLVHGNLCCRNLLVFRYEIDDILVKIGDPGMVSLMNSLDLSLPQNRSRLLFLAPELYPDCRKCDSKMTPQSDVFAFGTTLWEMFAHGQNPVETRKLKNLSNLEILQTPAHTRLDPPRSLDEATEWKRKVLDLMSLCWKPVEDRPAPNLLLRDLRAQVADYDSSQRGHGYSSIRREFEDDIQDQGRDGNAVPDLISSTQESQPIRPMLSPTLPPVNAAFIPPAPFMPTPSRASLNTESLSNKAGGVYNRSLPELPLDFKYIISSRRLQIQEKQLGSGHYGVVKEGMLFASQDDRSNPQKIAAKELKGDFQNVIDSEEFKEEAVLMSKLEHDNVVKFLGISDNMLILEYVEKGALNMYLRKFRKQNTYLPVWRLMKMISDVAQGMAYLASMRVIHCDLAGRNVLLTDKLVAKITDFGLAKILQKDKDYYTRSTGKELPLMWCSPESIANRKFTTKGDIWSYGILMWEVFTHAKRPVLCKNFSKEGFKKLEEGKRLERPTHCPELVYQFMEKCWKFKPEERPDFNEACQSCREFAKIYPKPEQRVPVEDAHMTQKAESSKMDWETSYSDIERQTDVPKPKYYAPKKRLDPKPRPVRQAQVAVPKTIYGRSGEEGSKENEEEWPVVVALDFGTMYSGYAFWRKENPSEITTGKWNTGSKEVLESLKTPTSLLLNQNNEVIEFGYKAEKIFKELAEDEDDKGYRYFRQFKMMLHNESLLDEKKLIPDHLKRPLKALEVFSLSIRDLRDECFRDFDNKRIKVDPDEILWILTVPAIWGESAKQFMRKAAEKAGIPSDQLKLALEPEAAAIYVMKEAKTVFGKDTVTTFNPGTKIMVADLGGGTADLTVLEVKQDRKMKQLHQSAGGAWGGNLINKKIWEIMAEIFRSDVIEDFKKLTSDFMEMESIIELKKRDITIGSKLELPIFPSLSGLCKQDYRTLIKNSKYGSSVKARKGKLRFEPDMVQKIFDLTFTNLFTVVEKVLKHENAVGVNDIILVGGFAQADIIVKQFEEKFSGYKVIVPTDPVLAVLKGAVMFGQDIDIISSRITPHTYGFDAMRIFMHGDPKGKKRKVDNVDYCVELFEKMVAIGESVDVGKTVEKEVFASSKEMKSMVLKFYQSEIKNPTYVTDRGCECIGKLFVEMPDLSGGTERSVMVSIKFGETEITVCGVDKTTGKKQETVLDFLGDTK